MPQLHVMRHRLNQILCLDNGKGIDRIIGIDRAKGKGKGNWKAAWAWPDWN